MSIRFTVPEEGEKFVINLAKTMSTKDKPVTPEAAALVIWKMGVSRKKALNNYSESPKGKRAVKAPKAAKVKAAPKAKAAKAAPKAAAAPAKGKARAKIGGSKANGAATNSLLSDSAEA